MASLLINQSTRNTYYVLCTSGCDAVYLTQSFTTVAGQTTITSISVYIGDRSNSTSSVVNVDVYANSGDLPTGSSLGNASKPQSSLRTGLERWESFTFASPISVTANTKYVIKLATTFSGTYAIRADAAYTHPYSGGKLSHDGSLENDYDLTFQVYGDAITTVSTSISAKANIFNTTNKSVQAKSAVYIGGLTKIISAKADIKKIANTATIQALADIKALYSINLTAKARILTVPAPILVSPINGDSIWNNNEYFIWEIPLNTYGTDMHFLFQVDDTDDTFSSLEVDKDTRVDYAEFEYWDGGSWLPFPSSGVPNSLSGNQVRWKGNLVLGIKYWRVQAVTLA